MKPDPLSIPSVSPLRIVLCYVLFGALWIIFSDLLVMQIVPVPFHTTVSIAKGTIFIALTALLLYHLIGRQLAKMAQLTVASRENEERLRTLGDNLPDSYVYQYFKDADGTPHFTYLSAGAERLHGVSIQNILIDAGILFRQIDPEQLPLLAKAETACLQKMTDFQVEVLICRADGEERWLQLLARPHKRADGQVLWDGVATDITERRRMEMSLHKLNRIYALLSDVNKTIVRVHEPQKLFEAICQIAVKRGGFRMAWLGLLDPQTKQIRPVAHAGKIDGYLEKLHIALDDSEHGSGPTAMALRHGKFVAINDIANDPRMVTWRTDALRLGYRASVAFPLIVAGVVRGTLNLYASETNFFDDDELKLFEDMTANISFALEFSEQEEVRKRGEATLHLQSAALQAAANAIVITDKNGSIEWVNPAFTLLTGYSAEEAIARNPRELVKSDIHDHAFYRKLWGTLLAGEVWRGEMMNRHKDGTLYSEGQTITPVKDASGKITHFIAIKRDLTEQHALEDQLRQSQKMESIGTLAGGIAHDFNNILTAIIGYGQMSLMLVAENDPLRHNIECMLQGTDRAVRLTQELLLFSRKKAGDKKPVDLNEVVTKVEKFLIKVIGEDITFNTVIAEGPIPILADEHQLEQVLMNLVTNASHAMPLGGVLTVTTGMVTLDKEFASVHGYGKPGSYALITVEDTGTGMDEKTQQRIFEPFFTTKEVGKGTGLGLAVVYGIIKQHDGYINVSSEPGMGSTFKIYLPVNAASSEEPLEGNEIAVIGGTETILLAEDDDMVRNMTKSVLTEFGYTVIEAVDGAEAVRKFMETHTTIDLLLLDLIMPKMNGKEALDEIRNIRPEIKVIFSSGYAPETIQKKVALADGIHLITKPASPHEILRKVRSVLDGDA